MSLYECGEKLPNSMALTYSAWRAELDDMVQQACPRDTLVKRGMEKDSQHMMKQSVRVVTW